MGSTLVLRGTSELIHTREGGPFRVEDPFQAGDPAISTLNQQNQTSLAWYTTAITGVQPIWNEKIPFPAGRHDPSRTRGTPYYLALAATPRLLCVPSGGRRLCGESGESRDLDDHLVDFPDSQLLWPSQVGSWSEVAQTTIKWRRNGRRFVHTTAQPYRPPLRPFRYHPEAVRGLLKSVETAGGC